MVRTGIRIGVFVCILALACFGETANNPNDIHQLAHDIFKQLVEIKSTESGVGSTPAVEVVAQRLRAAGFSDADIFIGGPEPRKQNIVARLHGSGQGKPILLLAHLDVVEANPADWSPGIDPFQFTERDGYFYGRGTQDIKDGATLILSNMIRWKREGWKPKRDIVMALTADEEGGGANGVDWLLKNHRNLVDAEYCINTDSGDFQEKNGKPYLITFVAAEKKYVAISLDTHNKGGHGSLPRKDNAIYELAAALQKVAAYQFPVDLNEVTRGEFEKMALLNSGQTAEDMKAVAANPNDTAAAGRLSQDPYLNAMMRTTCVATELQGGHAENALPQHAKAVLNCRILPWEHYEDVLAAMKKAVDDPQVEFGWATLDKTNYPSSPLRPDIMNVLEKTVAESFGKIPVMPGLELGASDGKYLRGAGIPTYGVPGIFIEEGDVRAHGKDERLGQREFYQGVDFFDKFVKGLLE